MGSLVVHGKGLYGLSEPANVLDAANSGTTMRLLSGILAGQPFYSVITGDNSLRHRPMRRIIEPLQAMGATIYGREHDKFPPLTIIGGNLKPISYHLPVASAQVKSCLLLAGLFAPGQTTIYEPAPSRDHTERMLRAMGVIVDWGDDTITVRGDSSPQAIRINVPGDISSAAFFLVAATIVPNATLTIKDVGINPTRTGMLDALHEMGADISIENRRETGGEPLADLRVRSSSLHGIDIRGRLIPRLIDELPVIAVAATQAEGRTTIADAQELRVKETDRIQAIVRELSRLGAKITEQADGFIIDGPTPLVGTTCQSYGDHRMAMSLAIAGLVASGTTTIEGAEAIDVSFPGFSDVLKGLSQSR